MLVHAGGSGVGTAAVQLVALFGGRSIVTAGSPEKLDKVRPSSPCPSLLNFVCPTFIEGKKAYESTVSIARSDMVFIA